MIPPKIKELLRKQLRNPIINIDSELKTLVNNLTALERWCIFLSYRSNSQLQNLIKLVTVEEESIKEIAQKMKTNGIEINIIANCTGLSKEEIETL